MAEKISVELKNVNNIGLNGIVLKNLNLKVLKGEFLTLLGKSGCGKTSVLRMIAGLEQCDGTILVSGKNTANLSQNDRGVSIVFKNYALFPHMNVFENIAYGLIQNKLKKSELRQRVFEIMDLLKLTGFEKYLPSQLSTAQKQRVSIARALISKPKVLLLDEPLGELNIMLRRHMHEELRSINKKLGITFIYTTQNIEEAFAVSDRIAVMNNGIEKIGTPDEIKNDFEFACNSESSEYPLIAQ